MLGSLRPRHPPSALGDILCGHARSATRIRLPLENEDGWKTA